MSPNGVLVVTGALFVGTHLALSHPFRDAMVERLGARGAQAVYSLVAIATFVPFVHAYARMPRVAPWWAVGDGPWLLGTAVMWLAMVLLAGSVVGNPALAGAPATQSAPSPTGVFAITRHPMMWAIALWALVHAFVIATPAAVILSVVLGGLAIGGSWGQERKKARLDGGRWRDWSRRTSFVPFAALVDGRRSVGDLVTGGGMAALVIGTVLWAVATWSHGALGWQAAGLFRWIG